MKGAVNAFSKMWKFLVKHKKITKPIAIVLTIILYWIFIYYPYHYSVYTPIGAAVIGTLLVGLGFYSLFIKKEIKFKQIRREYFIFLALMLISDICVIIASLDFGLIPQVDITLAWLRDNFGLVLTIVFELLSYPFFVLIFAGTYKILNKEHFYLWLLVFLAWTVSIARLFVNYVWPAITN
jgi:hypothetical protein